MSIKNITILFIFVFSVVIFSNCSSSNLKKIQLTCSDSINSLAEKADPEFIGTCPGSCTSGSVWGTDIYTTDSAICIAAIHAGATNSQGGDILITITEGKPAYTGSERNGIRTAKWGSYQKSFTVSKK